MRWNYDWNMCSTLEQWLVDQEIMCISNWGTWETMTGERCSPEEGCVQYVMDGYCRYEDDRLLLKQKEHLRVKTDHVIK